VARHDAVVRHPGTLWHRRWPLLRGDSGEHSALHRRKPEQSACASAPLADLGGRERARRGQSCRDRTHAGSASGDREPSRACSSRRALHRARQNRASPRSSRALPCVAPWQVRSSGRIVEEAAAAGEAGAFDAPGAHVDRTLVELDVDGWRELSDLLTDVLVRVQAIQDKRDARSPGDNHVRSSEIAILHFERAESIPSDADPGERHRPKRTPRLRER
jgi:hypothetical protein